MTVTKMSLKDQVVTAVHELITACMTDLGSMAVYDKLNIDIPDDVQQDPTARYVYDNASSAEYLVGMSYRCPHAYWVWVAPLYGHEEEPECLIPDWCTLDDALDHADLIIRQGDVYSGLIQTVDQIVEYIEGRREE